jgi:hypothetical protein
MEMVHIRYISFILLNPCNIAACSILKFQKLLYMSLIFGLHFYSNNSAGWYSCNVSDLYLGNGGGGGVQGSNMKCITSYSD